MQVSSIRPAGGCPRCQRPGTPLCAGVTETWTIRRMLDWAKADFAKRGIGSPRVDAEWMLADVLGTTQVGLYLDLDRPLSEPELTRFRRMVARRRDREPVAYILGRCGFYGREFRVGPAVLVPRPDSETLVDRALELLPTEATGPALDLCTGSGALGLTLAAERAHLSVDVTDISTEALEVARSNGERLELLARVRYLEGDLTAALSGDQRYTLAVANPPYISEQAVDGLMPEVSRHEPRLALVAGEDGYAFYRRLGSELPAWLAPGAHLLLEVGQGQAARVRQLLESTGMFGSFATHVDLGGVVRVVEATYHPEG